MSCYLFLNSTISTMFKETLLEKYKDTLKSKFKKLNNKLQLAVAQMALHPWWC